jgi:hypothetical protein
MPRGRDRDLRQAVGRRQHQPAKQHRADVVAVPSAAGDRFAGQACGYSACASSGASSSAFAATSAATQDAAEPPSPEPSGMPLSSSISKPNGNASASRRDERATGGVAFGLQRQVGDGAADRLDAHDRLIDATHRGDVADAGDAVAEDVEADADVADGAGRKRACFHASAHRRAPSAAARRNRSENTPAAVTSGTGARALHDERVVAIAASGELHAVVRQSQVGEGMVGGQFLQRNRRVAITLQARDITQHAAPGAGGLQRGLHRRVERCQPGHEAVAIGVAQGLGHQALHAHILERQRHAGFAAQDHQLARHVHAGQVVARIGLGVAQRMRLAHQVGERRAAVELVEQPGQGAGEDAVDRDQFVAGIQQVAQGRDHRQAGTDGGFVAEARAAARAGLADGRVAG